MTKQAFSTYTPSKNGKRTLEESISELQREMDTRKRIFDNWVAQGRVSWVDAHDRMERLLSALAWLIQYSNEIEQAAREASAVTSTPQEFSPSNQLDEHAAAAA